MTDTHRDLKGLKNLKSTLQNRIIIPKDLPQLWAGLIFKKSIPLVFNTKDMLFYTA